MTTPSRPLHAPLGTALGLLTTCLLVTYVLALAGVPNFRVTDLAGLSVICIITAAIRIRWSQPGQARQWQQRSYWMNLALTAVLVWLSPVFGLYLFLSYYEASLLPGKLQPIAGTVATGCVIALAQLGGPSSPLFTPLWYFAFLTVNLAIALFMLRLDGRRESLVSELAAANQALREEQEYSTQLTRQLMEQAREAGVTEERQRLSREIHDTVAQDLVAIIAQLDALSGAEGSERERRLGVVDKAARDALAEARRAVAALASPRLDTADLPLALDDLLGQWRSATGLSAELTVTGKAVTGAHDEVLLRAAQETLSNVARHAKARHADVALAYSPAAVSLTVADDGVGFDAAAGSAGFGLRGLRQRLVRLGGTLELDSRRAGTRVVAEIPLGAS